MAFAWPISMSGNFGYPELGYKIERIGPVELRTRFEDGGIVGREKVSAELRLFIEKWDLSEADMHLVVEFWEGKGTITPFLRREIDANSATWATSEVLVTFAKAPKYEKYGPKRWKVTLEFEQVVT